VFKHITELEYLLTDIDEATFSDASNKELKNIYQSNIEKYPMLKNYTLVIATNDTTTNNSFYKSIANVMNEKKFYDYNTNKNIHISHPWSAYSNLIYISTSIEEPSTDITVYVDSNAMNFFSSFYDSPKNNKNAFIDFKIENNVDLNYLPYMLEDHINYEHKSKKHIKTKEKIERFEIINNLDKKYYHATGILRIDKKKLEIGGYKSLREFVDDKFFYFNNFFEKKDLIEDDLPNNTIMFNSKIGKTIDIQDILSEYDLIYGYVLNILIEKVSKNDIENKVHNVLYNMHLNGQQLLQVLHFSYLYFAKEHKYEINKFFNFDLATWSYEKTIDKARNIAWDIYLYMMPQGFITKPLKRYGNYEYRANLGIPLFLTQDTKFYDTFIKSYSTQTIIIDETCQNRSFNALPSLSEEFQEFSEMLESFHFKNPKLEVLKRKRFKLFKKINGKSNLYAIRRLFREKMEYKLHNIFIKP
jgi:hypothetical protein